jgi:hypothetical protein
MAMANSAETTDPLGKSPTGLVIMFPAAPARGRRATPAAEAGMILLFTGVRYERHAAVTPEPSPRPQRTKARRGEPGPLRQA